MPVSERSGIDDPANDPPINPQRTLVGSSGLIGDGEGRYLLVHRRADRRYWPDLWDLPGGTVADDEDVDDALVRELREELGVEVESFQFLDTALIKEPASGRRAAINVYAVAQLTGEPANLATDEHDEIGWFTPDEFAAKGVLSAVNSIVRQALDLPIDHAAPGVEHVDMESTWDDIAEHYQAQAGIPTDKIHYGAGTPTENELQLLGDPAGKDLIDVGCGGAQNTIAFKRAGAARALGVDQSAEQLAFSQRLADQEGIEIELLKARVEDLVPLPDDSFDLAFSAYCFQFVQDIQATFRAVHRVLRPGGRFAFCVGHPAYAMFGEEGYDLSKPYFQRDAEFIWPFDDGHVSRMTVVHHTGEDLFDALRLAGFQVERLLEPEFTEREVGNWKRDVERAKSIPRTIIFAARKPEAT